MGVNNGYCRILIELDYKNFIMHFFQLLSLTKKKINWICAVILTYSKLRQRKYHMVNDTFIPIMLTYILAVTFVYLYTY